MAPTTMMNNISLTAWDMMNGTMDNDTANETYGPYHYRCDSGLFLPLISEFTWDSRVRAFLYFSGLLWCFLAVAIIADVFMCSIERITSKTRKIRVADANIQEGYRELEIRVWNDTVANLSLLALGTSAPEILLSVIEIVGNNFNSGTLGPGTIVGSAAFNLLVISAICIVSIPAGEIRRIKSLKVFAVTAISGIWAYVWLILVIKVISPGQVDMWEAIVTLLMFPALIFTAFMADRDCCMKKKDTTGFVEIGLSAGAAYDEAEGKNKYTLPSPADDDPTESDEITLLSRDLARSKEVTPEEASRLIAAKMAEKESHGRNWYRINATRMMGGGKRLVPKVMSVFQGLYEEVKLPVNERSADRIGIVKIDHSEGGIRPVVEFTAACCAILESEKKVRIGIKRTGNMKSTVVCRVETINGTAMSGSDYISFNEQITFDKNEALKQVFIEIVDDNEWEPDEFFFVKLSVALDDPVVVGNISINQVTIINDDEPGKVDFSKPSIVMKASAKKARVPVQRTHGADGSISVMWKTTDMTAITGRDYMGGEGELCFDHGETSKMIEFTILDSKKAERDETFGVELTETTGGAELGKIRRTIITIVQDDEFNGIVSRIVNMAIVNMDSLQLDNATWIDQFRRAMNVNGGDLDTATPLDYILHFATFVFKVIFAFIPPTSYLGGWLTFGVSLAVIGLLTAIIGDLASIFGCLINLPDFITAITLVALGTSMPDTFASKQAAVGEKTADSSIGNVNGSNSVNVFLGLGLPWVMATIYHAIDGSTFTVPTESLGFTVVVYTICAVLATALFIVRRLAKPFGNAELGGPFKPKIISALFMVFLWLVFAVLASLNSLGIIKPGF